MTAKHLAERLEERVPDNNLEQFMIRSCRWKFDSYNEMEKYGFEHSISIDYPEDESQMMLARVGRVAYAVFRGSKFFPVSIMDVEHVLVPYGAVDYGCRVHGIFLSTYMSMKKNLFEYVTVGGINTVVCVGHSMGGAIAQIAAVDISVRTDMRVKCCTFGSPMPGDRHFATRFACNVEDWGRYVLRGDPIRFVPEERDYVHPCHPTMIGMMSDEILLTIGRSYRSLMQLISGWKRPIDTDDIEERHGIHGYLAALRRRST